MDVEGFEADGLLDQIRMLAGRPRWRWHGGAEGEDREPTQLSLPGFRNRPIVRKATPIKVVRWVLRILARTDALDVYCGHHSRQPAIDALLGIADVMGPLDPDALGRLIIRRLEAAEQAGSDEHGTLQRNVDLLAAALGLGAAERELLEFRAQIWTQPLLAEMLRGVLDSDWSDQRLACVLAVAFDLDEAQAWPLLDRDNPLYRAGLLRLSDAANKGFLGKLEIQFGLSNALQRPARNVNDLLSFAVREAPAATLDVAAFPHLAAELDALSRFLDAAITERLTGVNVLLHGRPGVGKTELGRALPQGLGLRTFEIGAAVPKDEGSELHERLSRYRMTQALLGAVGGAVVVFDEIENALPGGRFFGEPKDSIKARLNELLETNPLPAFWIANDIGRIDPAYVRRFDFVLEVKAPPRSVRKAILRQCLGDLPVREAWLERQADDADIAPATAARAARVLRTLGHAEAERIEATYETLMRQYKVAAGLPVRRNAYPPIDDYRAEWLNVDADVPQLIEALARRPRGRLLFHGPPGTGKTGLAHHLARALDRPLRVRRASDLVSKWVGETEKNLCAMFEEAAADDAVLLLDEADSFLQDRSRARAQWEVTGVNELLTQMEGFGGLFICATNALDRLDQAAPRRFTLKLGFRPLRCEQAASLFAACYRGLAGRALSDAEAAVVGARLNQLPELTPGDFAAATGCWNLLEVAPSPEELLDALCKECALKPGSRIRTIGF